MKYNPQLDGLRCIAILLVFLGHTVPHARETVPLIGLAGVDMFFAISGFLITSILLNTEENFSSAYKIFIGRRTLRIFPLYYLTIALLFLAEPDYLNGKLAYLLTYTYIYYPAIQGDHISHVWSLCVEEQFYLVWPFLILSCRRNLSALKTTLRLLVLVFSIQIAFHLVPLTPMQTNIWPFPRGLGLLLGGLGAIFYKTNHLAAALFKSRIAEAATILLFILAILNDNPVNRIILPVVSLFFVLKIFNQGFCLLWLDRVLRNPIVVRLGIISYGFYLFHNPVHYWTKTYLIPTVWAKMPFDNLGYFGKVQYNPWLMDWFKIPVAFLLTAICAWLSYKCFEKPLLLLRDKWFPYCKKNKMNRKVKLHSEPEALVG